MEMFSCRSCMVEEGRGDDSRRRDPAPFQVFRVVDTPRRASPSVTPRTNSRVYFSVDLVSDRFCRSEVFAHLTYRDLLIVREN